MWYFGLREEHSEVILLAFIEQLVLHGRECSHAANLKTPGPVV